MKKITKLLLPTIALMAMGGQVVNPITNSLNEVHQNEVKRAYSNSKNLVLPTSQGSFLTNLEPRSNYLGYAWGTQGGLGTVSSSTITFASDISASYDSFATRFKSNVAIGYVAFRFATMDSGNSSSQKASVYYPSTTINEAALGSSMFKVESGYYAIIEDISQWNSLEKFEGSLTRYKGNIGGGTFGIDYCFINKENTLINGQTENLYYYVPNVPTMQDILGGISAKDLFGADCTVTCSDSEKAKYNQKIGVSTVVINASDTYGQTATATLVIHVIDNGKPVIALASGKNLSFVAGNGSLSLADLPSYFTITDVGTSYGGTLGTPSFTYDGSAYTDKTFGASEFGTHTIGVTVADSSGNSTTANFSLSVTDGTAPVITRRDSSDVSTVIKVGVSRTFSLTKAEFLQIFKATDNVDGDLSSSLAVDGDFIGNKVGTYNVKINCADKSGNTGSITATVQVIADLPPVFILSDILVQATTAQALTTADLSSVVTNGILSGKTVTACSVNAGTYIGNENVAGDYTITYTATVSSGVKSLVRNASNDVVGSFILRVVKSTGEAETQDNAHWYTPIVEFFQKLGNWFRGVFTKFKFDCFITNAEWEVRYPATEKGNGDSTSAPVVEDSTSAPAEETSSTGTEK